MYYKCELLIGGYVYDVTDDLENWADVELTLKRGDYDGVVRSFSTKFSFANGAYSLLIDEYQRNYLQAGASIVFYKSNNSWLWNEVFRCALDFSTLSHDGYLCQINAIDNGLAAMIKAKQGTQYEYVVNEIKEAEALNYDHLEMMNKAEWTLPPSTEENSLEIVTGIKGYYSIPMYLATSELSTRGIAEFLDQEERKDKEATFAPSDNCFFRNTSGKTILVKFTGSFKMIYSTSGGEDALNLYVSVSGGLVSYYPVWSMSLDGTSTIYMVNIDVSVAVENGGWLSLDLYRGAEKEGTITIYDVVKPVLTFTHRGDAVSIDVVKPVTLLNRLLKSMNGGVDGITGVIADSDERLNQTMLMAADSARGMPSAKLYSSYTKFTNWMKTEFGFVPVIGDSSVTFVHRDTLFTDDEAKDLGNDVTDWEYSVNASLIYARVRVGYERVDYESVNGKDEFRFTQEYTTGTTLTDNVLELISPYRADAYGIEFLVNKRGEETTDDESDNDVFMVGVTLADGTYQLLRDVSITGVLSSGTMYNGMYAQKAMIEANKKYIGVFTTLLEYASSDGNSDVSIAGERVDSDVSINERLFTVDELTATTKDTSIPTVLNGVIKLEKQGKTYKGYLKDVDFGIGKEQSVKYSLIVKEVN